MTTSAPPPPSIDTSPIPKGRVSITPNLLSKQQVEALLEDAKGLHRHGVFVPGGLRRRKNKDGGSSSSSASAATTAMKTTTDTTTRICDICGIFDDAEKADPSIGNIDAREDLLDLMADLRELLQLDLGIRLSEGMELQYLRYPGGSSSNSSSEKKKTQNKMGFYGRHFDRDPDDVGGSTCRRKISLLLYLNDETWDAKRDGGVLRAYLPAEEKTPKRSSSDGKGSVVSSYHDITPKGGTLVLFDSASVEHEVLPTHRERWAVVGWFLGHDDVKMTVNKKRRRGDDASKDSSPRQQSGPDQPKQRRRKKKKKKK
jgi:hypothetical protein